MRNLYEVLGVASNSSLEEIKTAYKRLGMSMHPDREGGSSEKFMELALAYEVLSDPERRTLYDATGNTQVVTDKAKKIQDTLIKLFINAVEAEGTDDVIGNVRLQMQEAINANALSKATIEQRIKKLEKRIALIKVKEDAQSVVLDALNNYLDSIKGILPKFAEVNEFNNDILKALDDYESMVSTEVYPTGYTFIDAFTGQPVTMRTV
jgi:curved DNA-binding protein CbpA